MKESRLIQMKKQVEVLGMALESAIKEIGQLKVLVMGDHQVIKRLKEFPEIIEQIRQENGQEEDTSGTAPGDSDAASSSE